MENQLGHNTPDLSSYSLHLATIKNKQINHTLKKKKIHRTVEFLHVCCSVMDNGIEPLRLLSFTLYICL